jgi:surface carbohydrate biosynthesis protein
MKKEIDVLWLIEHIAREMDVACAVKAIAESKYGLRVEIRNIYYHAKENMECFQPLVVVHPFFYYLKEALATEDYVKTWPRSVHFNLAWEEIHYKAHQTIKAPTGEFVQKKVLHHAWGDFYKRYLRKYGVPEEHIFVNGQPAYQLYFPPYREYYHNREWLAQKYGLDPSKRWVFIPENYRWAFTNKFKLFTQLGGDKNEMLALQDFSLASLKVLLEWCNASASHEDITIIFRPRPATNSKMIMDFVSEKIGTVVPNLHFIKEESVREWTLASDVVFSSYSTSLIEAAIAGKPAYIAEPLPFPESLYYDWYKITPHVYTKEEFETACWREDIAVSAPLRSWAIDEMLSHGDPIQGLASYVNELVVTEHRKRFKFLSRLTWSGQVFSKKPGKVYFNPVTHENDVFTPEEVDKHVADWKQILR